MEDQYKNILIILPNNLGDVIMTTPLLRGLRKKHRDSRLTFLVEEGFGDCLSNNTDINEIISLPRKPMRNTLMGENWREGVRAVSAFRNLLDRKAFTWIINLSQHHYVSFLLGAVSTGCITGQHFLSEGNHAIDDSWSRYLYAIPFQRTCNKLHAADVYRRIGGVQGEQIEHAYTLSMTDTEKRHAVEVCSSRGIDCGGKIIIMQTGAAYLQKQWTAEHYVTLGQMLVNDGWQIILTGAGPEAEQAGLIAESIGKSCWNFAGKTTFRQALAIVSLASHCVTPDTAIMHAAAALQVRVIALFGTTSPVETGPYGEDHWVLSGTCSQKPCFFQHCNSHTCMESISPDMVYACITHNSIPRTASVNAYKTGFSPDGDYALTPITTQTTPYYNSGAADLTRFVFGDTPAGKLRLTSENKEQCRQTLSILSSMENELTVFLNSKDITHIRAFEELKNKITHIAGPGQFFAAALNIHLNSIAILNPLDGIVKTREACRSFNEQIKLVLKNAVE